MRIDGIKRLTPPGNLRHQITWQRKAVTGRSASGEEQYTWDDVVVCRAAVLALSGREAENAQRIWSEARWAVQQHYVPGMSAEYRGLWWVDGQTRVLEVLDVQERDGTGRWQWVICRELR